MPQVEQQKNHFVLNKGLNTESNEVSFPDGFTTDEQNYELLIGGGRRRRKGLAEETGGAGLTTEVIAATDAHATFVWRGAGGDPTKNFIVNQIADRLYFSDDAETVSTTWNLNFILVGGFAVDQTTSVDTVGQEECQFDEGRGRLFVSNPHCNPFYIEYDPDADTFTAIRINLRIRDFDGIEDGVGAQSTPATLTADHEYNLRNQGWKDADIENGVDGYFDDQAAYPSKHIPWFKGYRRQTNVSFSDLDGIQVFDSNKVVAEQSGTSLAPMGSLLLNPMDTTFSANTENEGDEVPISDITIDSGSLLAGGTYLIAATAHGRATNDVVNLQGTLLLFTGFGGPINHSLDGNHTIVKINDDSFTIIFAQNPSHAFLTFASIEQLGVVGGNPALPNSDGVTLAVGPRAITYHGARVWYAGIAGAEFADTVFFSKIAQKAVSFGKCYQEADPTNPEFNALSSSDGGTIVIPKLGKVQRMLSLGNQLLIFSDQGVWEIGGGQRGVFTATGFSVRKITNADCNAAKSPLIIGNRGLYTGPQGIHSIGPNQFTGVLEETNTSQELLESFWNAIPIANQEKIQTIYDGARNRVYFLYGDVGDTANMYANALILDLKVGAFYKYVFNTAATVGILSAVAITESDSSDSNKKIKWLCQTSTTNIDVCDMDQTDYIDFDGAESPLPFMITGWDNLGDFQRRRQAPVITVFAKRTETGYTATGNGWDADNESSNLLTARWDWTDDSVTGKIGSQNETYRHVRAFVPSGAADVDGYPVVVTRNKVRGRGRVLQLRFDGAATKDSHLLGFSTNYKISRKA